MKIRKKVERQREREERRQKREKRARERERELRATACGNSRCNGKRVSGYPRANKMESL